MRNRELIFEHCCSIVLNGLIGPLGNALHRAVVAARGCCERVMAWADAAGESN